MGIGTAAFSVMNAVLLRPPPYSDAKQIVAILDFSARRGSNFGVTPARFLDIQNENRSFETIAAFRTSNQTFVLTGIEEPQLLHGARVSKDFFRLFGVAPILGRTFDADAETPESIRTVVLSQGLWCSRYACDQNILGRPVILDGEAFTVIGVMPKSFKIYGRERPMDLWLPLPIAGEALADRTAQNGEMTGINEAVAPYRRLYVVQVIRYWTELLSSLEYKAMETGSQEIPFFREIFAPFYNDDSYVRTRTTWDKL
jgi:hypothetical protein